MALFWKITYTQIRHLFRTWCPVAVLSTVPPCDVRRTVYADRALFQKETRQVERGCMCVSEKERARENVCVLV